MTIKIIGDIDGQPIWRDETSFDRMAIIAEQEHQKHLDRMAEVNDEPAKVVEVDPDDYRDNNENR